MDAGQSSQRLRYGCRPHSPGRSTVSCADRTPWPRYSEGPWLRTHRDLELGRTLEEFLKHLKQSHSESQHQRQVEGGTPSQRQAAWAVSPRAGEAGPGHAHFWPAGALVVVAAVGNSWPPWIIAEDLHSQCSSCSTPRPPAGGPPPAGLRLVVCHCERMWLTPKEKRIN